MFTAIHRLLRMPLAMALLSGITGGAIVLAAALIFPTRWALLLWVAVASIPFLIMRLVGVPSYWRRFAAGALALAITAAPLYVYILTVDNPAALSMPVLEHAWRVGMIAILAALLAAPLAFLSGAYANAAVRQANRAS